MLASQKMWKAHETWIEDMVSLLTEMLCHGQMHGRDLGAGTEKCWKSWD